MSKRKEFETPERIWLIDLGDEITWCDSPDPSDDIDERDVTEYIRADTRDAKTQADAAFVTLVQKLTEDEGDTVTIINDNPDFGGPNSCIETTKAFGPEQSHYGDSVMDCLRDAIRNYDKEAK